MQLETLNWFIPAPYGSLGARHRRNKYPSNQILLLACSGSILKEQNEVPEPAITSNYVPVFSKESRALKTKADVSHCKQDCFSSQLWKRSTVLISVQRKTLLQQSMSNLKKNEGGVVRSYFNEPGNVMHLAQQLWWESINSNINARIWVAIHVSQALQLRENTVVLLHGLALLERSPETCRTFSLHILPNDVSLCSTSVKQITPTVCRWDGPGNGHCVKFWFA